MRSGVAAPSCGPDGHDGDARLSVDIRKPEFTSGYSMWSPYSMALSCATTAHPDDTSRDCASPRPVSLAPALRFQPRLQRLALVWRRFRGVPWPPPRIAENWRLALHGPRHWPGVVHCGQVYCPSDGSLSALRYIDKTKHTGFGSTFSVARNVYYRRHGN
jgi:hypothetical protein